MSDLPTTHTINTEELTFIVGPNTKHRRNRTTGEIDIIIPAGDVITVIGRITLIRSTTSGRGEVFTAAICNYGSDKR